jgi:hypothetical protein
MPIIIRDPSDLSQDYTPQSEAGNAPTVTDYGNAALGTVGSIGAGLSSIGRNIAESSDNPEMTELYKIYQTKAQRTVDESRKSMSEGGRRALESEVTSSDFWEHPFQAIAMKGAAMAPYLVAGALPGGIVGAALGETAGLVASGVAGGALNVGAFINDIDQRIDKASDKELIDQSDLYAGWRDRMGPEEARKELKAYMAGDGRTALTAIVGAIGGVVGPTGAVARASSGANALINAAERKALGRFGVGALEGAAGMGIQTGASAAAGQSAAIAGGFQQDYDWHQWTAETLEAMGLGGLISGTMGAALGTKHGVEKVNPKTPDAAQLVALKGDGFLASEFVGPRQPGLRPGHPYFVGPMEQQGPGIATGPQANQPHFVGPLEQQGPRDVQGPRVATGLLPGDSTFVGPLEQQGPRRPEVQGPPRPEQIYGPPRPDQVQGPVRPEVYGPPRPEVYGPPEMQGPRRPEMQGPVRPEVYGPPEMQGPRRPEVQGPPEMQGPRRPEVQGPPERQGPTLPESEKTLRAQRQELIAGERPLVFYPEGTVPPTKQPEGMMRYRVAGNGIYDYNPKLLKGKELSQRIRDNTVQELMGLGPFNKDQVAASFARGNPEVAVVERNKSGTETRAAASTTELAPTVKTEMEKNKKAGNTVALEPVNKTIEERTAAAQTKPKGAAKPKELTKKEVTSESKPTEATKPKEVTSESKPPEATKPLEVKPEEPPTPKTKPTGRVLEAIDAAQKRAEINAGVKKNIKRGEQADKNALKEGPESGNWTKSEIEHRTANNATAKEIVAAHPVEGAIDKFYRNERATPQQEALAKTAMLERARKMANDALEKLRKDEDGKHLPERIRDNANADMQHSAEIMLLHEANRLAGKTKPTKADFDRFWEAEKLLRKGDVKGYLESKRAANRDVGTKFKGKEVEAVENAAPAFETASNEAPRFAASPEESMDLLPRAAREAAEARRRETERLEKEYAQFVKDQKAAELADKEAATQEAAPVYGAAKKPFAVETKRRDIRRTRGAGEGEGLSPQPNEIVHTTNVADSVKSVNIGALAGLTRTANRGIVMKFLERIRQAVGDKDVLIVSQATMDRLNPTKKAGSVDGYYDPQKGHIVVSERFVKDGKIDASILAHEGMHALVQEGLDSNAGLKKTVQEMLDHVKDQFPGQKHYGLENVHEFLSEAVSNAQFQNILMKMPVPENIAKQLDLKTTNSLWDAMVKSIQKFLGFKDSEHNMLTAALRAAEQADNSGASIRDHERSIADIRRMLRTSEPETYKDRFDRYVETFREQALDFNRPVEKLVEQIEKAHGKLSDVANVYIQKRLTEARLLERKRQVADYAERTMLPLMKDAEKVGVTPSNISDMLIARHAKERNDYLLAQDPKTKKNAGMTTADADALLKKINADPAKKAIFDRAVEVNDKLRDMYLEGNVEYGLIDRKTANALRDQFKTFTSLRGFEDEDTAIAAKRSIGVTGRQTSVIGNEYRATKGRETKSDNALHNMLQDVVRMYERGERNLVIKSAADAAQVAKFANDADSPYYIANSVNDKNIRGYDNARNDPRILGFKEDGKQKFLVFKDQDLAEAVQRVSPDQVPAFFRGLVNSTNMLKSLWTHYSPAFLIRHFIFRYPIEGVMNLQGMAERGFDTSATKYLKDSFADIPAMRDYLQGKPVTDPKLAGYIKEMAEAGGVVSFKHISDSLDLKKQIEVLATKKPNSILEAIKQGHEVWETTLTATDNAQRLAIYTRAREAGMSPQRAALAARDATVDFAKKGRASSWINIWIPFGNVALQTTGRMANAWKESPTYRKTVFGIMAGMTAVEMMNYTMGGTDKDGTPWIDKIPAHERLQNLVMVTPFKDKEGKPYVFKIPLPYPLFAVSGAGNGAAQSVMSLAGVSKLKQGDIATRVFHGVAETFTPVGHQINSLQTLATPEVARFISDISANKDWKGDPIHTDRAKPGMMKSEQGYKSTDQSWKTMAGWLGKIGMDMYPEDVKYTVDHFIGAERRFVRDTVDTFSGDKNPLTTNPISKILVSKPEVFADSSRFRNLSEKATIPTAQMEAVEAKALGRSLNAAQKALIVAAESRTGMTAKQIYEVNKASKEVKQARRDDEDPTAIQQKALKKFNSMGIMGGVDKH